MELHESAEDYLEAILRLREEKGRARSVEIAELLQVSKPSVSIAMKKLRENGYAVMLEDGSIDLTPEGLAAARRTWDRHKTLTHLLAQLGVDENAAEKDACKMEHDLSEETMDAFRQLSAKLDTKAN